MKKAREEHAQGVNHTYSTDSIPNSPEKVNSKDSRSDDRDSEYLSLAKDPEKNASKLREMVETVAKKAGYTIEAYHGTDADFYKFSLVNRGKNGEVLGIGYYFTDDKTEAKRYGNVKSIAFYY